MKGSGRTDYSSRDTKVTPEFDYLYVNSIIQVRPSDRKGPDLPPL